MKQRQLSPGDEVLWDGRLYAFDLAGGIAAIARPTAGELRPNYRMQPPARPASLTLPDTLDRAPLPGPGPGNSSQPLTPN